MKTEKRRIVRLAALSLAALLLICAIIAGMIVLPQLHTTGRRYAETKEFKNKGEIRLIAHRGLSGLELENTVPAFLAAGQREYYGIETNIRVTKDGKFIIVHDDDLRRIAGLDMRVEETDFQTLRALRFKDVYGNSEEKIFWLPTLEEYIGVCKAYDKQAILELKNPMTETQVRGIAAQVDSLGWLNRTTFISFYGENLLSLRSAYENADAQYLTRNCTEEKMQFMISNRFDAALHWSCVTEKRVRRLHAAGLKVNCWTVDGAACATVMKDCGVDMITTNILE